jgi:capsular exopolysaccharide synthesis family protein
LNQLEIDKAKLSLRFNVQHPDIRNLNNQIAGVKEQLRKALQSSLDLRQPTQETLARIFVEYRDTRTQLAFAKARLQAALTVREEVKRQTSGLPETSMQYMRLANEATQARTLFASSQAALNAAIAGQDTITGNIQVTSAATPPRKPYEPNLTKNLFTGGLLGVGLAFALVLLFEHSDRRLRSMKDIRRIARGQIVGTLPKLSRAQIHALSQGDVPPQAMEVYGMVRANLALAVRSAIQGDPWRQQVILVTSAIPGEGKSITAATLARSIARAGKTVILVDADMRRPAQNRLFNVEEAYGLADVLASRLTLDDTLVASDTEKLTLLPSGSPERNPTELISLPQTAAVVARLRSEADVVVIDAPACSTVADALLLAPHVDNILYIIGAGQVSEELVQETTHALRAAAPKTLVYFINRAPREHKRAYSNYYYPPSGNGAGPALALKTAPLSVETTANGGFSTSASPTMTLMMDMKGSYLTALEGPYEGQSFSLNASDSVLIGRSPDNTIILSQDPRVSRRHAHIALEKGRHVLHDDGSANGTFVNEMRVTSQQLTPGDTLQFGESKFRYE